MLLQHIQVKLVNVHRNIGRIATILETDKETHILLIQELWVGRVAVLHLDDNPDGIDQIGATAHPEWEALLPRHDPDDTCKAIAFVRKPLMNHN
jgi:hypothetical protein